ncbi:hypothetical protein [Methylobacter svalbardensis]|uniref:hypothetical protein n=1 Tax=Methylobacter svalbardensis TaxID=3080016 RepID=UPI0030ECA527
MNPTIFLTIFSGVTVYVLGQIAVKLVIDPVQDFKKTIGQISHYLIEYKNIIDNPGVGDNDKICDASQHLRKLSSQLQAHLYLVPLYTITASTFRLPGKEQISIAGKALIGLSNSLHHASENVYAGNSKDIDDICNSLNIYKDVS